MKNLIILLRPLLFSILLVWGVVVLDDFGVTWDEPVHFASGDLYLSRILDTGQEGSFSAADFSGAMQYYGPVFDIWGALNYRVFSEMLGRLAGDNARHLHLLIAGILTVLFTYLLVEKALSTRIAVFAALFLIAFPRFVGHSFNNPKDIPLACIFVISVYLYYLRLSTGKKRFSLLLLVAGAIGFATRIQYVLLPVLLITFTIIYICIKYIRSKNPWRVCISFWDLYTVILLCLPAGIIFWPYFWSDTLVKLQKMVEFYIYHLEQVQLLIRYWGEDYIPGQNMPWHYAPVMLAITTPLITLGAFLVGFLRIIISWFKGQADRREERLFFLFSLLWIVIGIIPFILPGQRVYGGIRHFLFIIPAFCIIAALGMEGLVRWMGKKNRNWSYLVVTFLFVLLFVSVYSYHPYYTVYYNQLVGGPRGALNRFSLENWGNSYKKACRFINKTAPAGATVLVMLIPDIPRFYLRPDIRVVGPEYINRPGALYDYSIYIIRDMDLLKKKDKKPIFTISVKGQPICNVHQW